MHDMSLTRALAPIAVVVAVIAALVWLMLVNDVALGPWLLALLVFGHAWVHLMFIFPKPESPNANIGGSQYPFDFGRSWLIRRAGLGAGSVGTLGAVLMAATFILGLLTALATVAIIVPAGWWGGLMMATALSSSLLLVLFYSPALLLGFAINLAMVALVLSDSWSPA